MVSFCLLRLKKQLVCFKVYVYTWDSLVPLYIHKSHGKTGNVFSFCVCVQKKLDPAFVWFVTKVVPCVSLQIL